MPTFNYVSNSKLLHYFVQSWFCTEADLQALGIASVLVANGSNTTTAVCKVQGVNAAVFQCGSPPTASFSSLECVVVIQCSPAALQK